MKAKIIFLLIAALLIGAIGTYAFVMDDLKAPGPLPAAKLVYIEPGHPTRAIAETLYAEGAIDHPDIFLLGAHLRQIQGSLKAGEYQITPGMSPFDIIALLQSGKTYHHKLTIPEGLSSTEIVALLNQAEAMTGTITAVPPEGTLLPETYDYSKGDTRQSVLGRMQKSMTDTVAALWAKHADNIQVKTPEEAVTLASVVEKETALPQERPRIAGVFMNRLRTGMPLQSDPTVIYAITLGKTKLDHPLSRAELDTDSPYNTYKIPGLPQGPIANPGKMSIEAAMNPEVNDYLYFVADGSGGHAFGKTLEEHVRNVNAWRALQSK